VRPPVIQISRPFRGCVFPFLSLTFLFRVCSDASTFALIFFFWPCFFFFFLSVLDTDPSPHLSVENVTLSFKIADPMVLISSLLSFLFARGGPLAIAHRCGPWFLLLACSCGYQSPSSSPFVQQLFWESRFPPLGSYCPPPSCSFVSFDSFSCVVLPPMIQVWSAVNSSIRASPSLDPLFFYLLQVPQRSPLSRQF